MQNPSSIYIEQANVGTALYHEFKREFNMLRLSTIDRHKNKFHRAREVQAFLERGGMYIPADMLFSEKIISKISAERSVCY